MLQLFGFKIMRADESSSNEKNMPSIVTSSTEDGAVDLSAGGASGSYVNLESTARHEGELITKYRDMALQHEMDFAIQDIVNEAIVVEDHNDAPVEISLDNVDQISDSTKKIIREEFQHIISILNFNKKAYEIFRRWYIDGRIFYHIVINKENTLEGIKQLRYIDPRKIKKIKEPLSSRDPKTGATVYTREQEYYLFNPRGLTATNQGVKVAADSICYVPSGIVDSKNNFTLSYLHKAIKPLNQLRFLEDAVVVYRLSRAPERRIFYIDVGSLPKAKAEQYVRDMMVKHKNKLVYDAQTGEVKDDRKFMPMLEDFWIPRREGGRGTEITTLPGGQNLGEMEDVLYFQKRLYKSLNVPIARLETETQFNLGRASEITRDEIKFSKFIKRLRDQFSNIFLELLRVQLILKQIVNSEEWDAIKQQIAFDYKHDNHFSELKEIEMNRERMSILNDVDQYIGKYFSKKWVQTSILRQSEEEIDQINKEIKEEGSDKELEDQQDQENQQKSQ
jgi:hypothetical protein